MSQHDITDWNQIYASFTHTAASDWVAAQVESDRIYQQLAEALWHSLGEVRGRAVLDVGCGTGWFSRLLLDAGAIVVGVDGAAEALTVARHTAPGALMLEHNLVAGLPVLDQQFDRVLAHMVLQDLPTIDVLLAAIHDVLAPGGRFVCTMPHPCFFNIRTHRDETSGQLVRMVPAYLAPEVWRINSFGGHNHYHRSLTYYVEALRAAGSS